MLETIKFDSTREEMLTWLDSDEGIKSLDEFIAEMLLHNKFKKQRIRRCCNYLVTLSKIEFNKLMGKLIWNNKSNGHLDRTISLLFDSVAVIGEEIIGEVDEIFLQSSYEYQHFIFKTHVGQGECIREILTLGNTVIYSSN
jgi:hypothetical protein